MRLPSPARAVVWRAGRRAVDWSAAKLKLASYVPFYDYREQLNLHTTYLEDARRVRDKRPSTVDETDFDLTLTVEGLEDVIGGRDWSGKRVLVFGPKHGTLALWIDAKLRPSELVFSDFEADRHLHEQWEDRLQSPHRWVYGDLRSAAELRELEPFDVVFFLGVLYHSAFHLPLLGMLNRVTRLGGEMLLETTIDPRPDAAVPDSLAAGAGRAAVPRSTRCASARLDRLARRDALHRLPAGLERSRLALPQDGRTAGQADWSTSSRRASAGVTRALALAAIVVAGTVTYGSLGGLLKGPSVFADELIYMDATRSVADGHRPMERDQTYGRGLLFPVVAAPVVAVSPNQLDAYRALQWFNAFLFSLAAIPAFFLARRMLGPGWSLAVAALTVAAPSAVYSGMILTEAAAYVTGTCVARAAAGRGAPDGSAPAARSRLRCTRSACPAPARGTRGGIAGRARAALVVAATRGPSVHPFRVTHAVADPCGGGLRRRCRSCCPGVRTRVAAGLPRRLQDVRRPRGRALELVHARRPGSVSRGVIPLVAAPAADRPLAPWPRGLGA
jgi:hypothetical protein